MTMKNNEYIKWDTLTEEKKKFFTNQVLFNVKNDESYKEMSNISGMEGYMSDQVIRQILQDVINYMDGLFGNGITDLVVLKVCQHCVETFKKEHGITVKLQGELTAQSIGRGDTTPLIYGK